MSRSAGLASGQSALSWGPDDSIVFAQGNGRGLFRVPASGGQPQNLAAPDATKGEANYFVPSMLPGGQALLYTVVLHDGQTRIMVRSLQGGDGTAVVEGGFGGGTCRLAISRTARATE